MVQGQKVNKLEEERRLKLYRAGGSDRDIAAGIYTRSTIGCWRKRRGLLCHREANMQRKNVLQSEMVEKIRNCAHDGLSDDAIGKVMGMTKCAVKYQRDKHGIASGWVNARNMFISRLMELHKNGKATREIAKELACSEYAIRYWCKQMFLKPNRAASTRLFKALVGKEEAAMQLYKEMKSDEAIAKGVCVSVTTIRKWRVRNNLPRVLKRKRRLVLMRIRKLHKLGMRDEQIGEKLGFHKNTVQYYRYRAGLKANLIKPLMFEADKEKIRIAWSTGATDNRCAKALGMSIGTYYYHREKMGLKPWLYGRQCKICGKSIVAVKMQHLCGNPKCNEELEQTRVEKWFLVKHIRSSYMGLAFCDPEKALEIREQMVREEGEEFTEMAIDGITPQMAEEHIAKKMAAMGRAK